MDETLHPTLVPADGGPDRVQLLVRVGRADETAATSGCLEAVIAAAVEHAAAAHPDLQIGALVSSTVSSVTLSAPHDDPDRADPSTLWQGLSTVMEHLADPDLGDDPRRWHHGADRDPRNLARLHRHGLRGSGLAVAPSWGLLADQPELSQLARHFTTANARLLATTTPPPGWAPPWLTGEPVGPVATEVVTRADDAHPTDYHVVVSVLVSGWGMAQVLARTMATALNQQLIELGHDLDVESDCSHVSPDRQLVVLSIHVTGLDDQTRDDLADAITEQLGSLGESEGLHTGARAAMDAIHREWLGHDPQMRASLTAAAEISGDGMELPDTSVRPRRTRPARHDHRPATAFGVLGELRAVRRWRRIAGRRHEASMTARRSRRERLLPPMPTPTPEVHP
ncbi:hypothetical protein [Aestuariimicrobium ganziense]|uniref:hypothetical protein n=1 Tax=Aestuariimicrobium ganziense TaxID=2773677 RepID=UPI0019414D6A|nr:hypothetical protein [Aestuariimicrobium ganziense]